MATVENTWICMLADANNLHYTIIMQTYVSIIVTYIIYMLFSYEVSMGLSYIMVHFHIQNNIHSDHSQTLQLNKIMLCDVCIHLQSSEPGIFHGCCALTCTYKQHTDSNLHIYYMHRDNHLVQDSIHNCHNAHCSNQQGNQISVCIVGAGCEHFSHSI